MILSLFKKIITNILTVLYQPFWVSITLAIFVSFFYLYAYQPTETGRGTKAAFKAWWKLVKESSFFRKFLVLDFCGTLILCKTIYYRSIWVNPLVDVMGGWGIWKVSSSTGEIQLTTECFENVLLILPFIFMLLWTFDEKVLKDHRVVNIAKISIVASFCFSFTIEAAQLIFRVGTWQLADLFYNTLGGFIGGLIYWSGWKIKSRIKNDRR